MSHRTKLYHCILMGFLCFTVFIETVTLCSHVMPIMSVSKKSDNSEGQQNTV